MELYSAGIFKTSSVFFFISLTSENFSLSSALSYEETGKCRMAQGGVNGENDG